MFHIQKEYHQQKLKKDYNIPMENKDIKPNEVRNTAILKPERVKKFFRKIYGIIKKA